MQLPTSYAVKQDIGPQHAQCGNPRARCGSQHGFSTDRRILRFSSAAWMRVIIRTSITSFGRTQLKSQPPHFRCG
jgi:hypothetical protein